jgi:hypothetical protein
MELKLFVFLVGSNSAAFSVKIDSSETIDELKEAILAKKPHDLKDIDADRLTLYKVALDGDDDKKLAHEAAQATRVESKLKPSFEVSDYFSTQPPRGNVSIVATLPHEFALGQ